MFSFKRTPAKSDLRVFGATARTAHLLLRANEVVFAFATFPVKEWWSASIEVFQLIDERMMQNDY